jgi:AcrR family transcriptional regulator
MSPHQQKSERARVREALIDLCSEQGFRNTSLAELLDRAAISQADFERHYVDLEDCFYQFWKEELRRFEVRATQAAEGLTSWRDRLRATAYALYRYLAEDEKLTRVTVSEMRTAGEPVLLLFGQAAQALFELIDEGREELSGSDSVSVATAESVGGGIFNQIYMIVGRGGSFAPEEVIVPQLMYAVVLPYVGPEAAKEELEIPPPPVSG